MIATRATKIRKGRTPFPETRALKGGKPFDQTGSFDQNIFDGRMGAPHTNVPKAVSSGLISARGLIIRDGSNQTMKVQPNFDSILDAMNKNINKPMPGARNAPPQLLLRARATVNGKNSLLLSSSVQGAWTAASGKSV